MADCFNHWNMEMYSFFSAFYHIIVKKQWLSKRENDLTRHVNNLDVVSVNLNIWPISLNWFIIVLSLQFWISISVLVLKSDNILTTHTLSNSQSNFIQSIKPTPVTLLLLQNNCRPNIYELLIFSLLCSHLKTVWIKPLWTQRLWPLWHCTCFTIYSTSLHAYF